MRIFSSAPYCLRVARRMFLMTCSAGAFPVPDFCLIFAPLKGYDEPEILRYQLSQFGPISADAGHDDVGRQALDQRIGLRRVTLLAGGECAADWTAQPAHGHVDLGAQAATRAAKGLIFSPLFAPAACWWARMMVESTIRYSKSASSAIAAKMRHQIPL